MSHRLLLGAADEAMAREVQALVAEAGQDHVVEVAGDDGEVSRKLERGEGYDVVLLHEELGPLPVLDFARQLSVTHPEVPLVLLVRGETPELLRAALHAGARGILSAPFALEQALTTIDSAAAWSRTVRARSAGEAHAAVSGIGGSMVAVAGAKGGVGTSTVAVQMALALVADRGRSVCLVDFDLQAGDLRLLLDLPIRRSVADLVSVADELTGRQLEETLFVHPTGMRVLLAPEHGEQGEDVRAQPARLILGALKLAHDVVVVDVGSMVTEAAAVAVELADEVLMVTVPDVPALRAANRLGALWRRLDIREGDVQVLLNRNSKDNEIQADMARRVLEMPMARTVVPAGFRALEPAVNTGAPERLADGTQRAAFRDLVEELGLLDSQRQRARLLAEEAGQVAVETTALILVLAVVLLGMWEIVLTGYTYVLSGNAAREASRALAVGEPADKVRGAASQKVPQPWRGDMRLRQQHSSVTVTLSVPALIPGVHTPIRVSSEQGTVVENQPLPASQQ